jgi:uncharacterized membrane protein YdjX (TVP38/TMEM64 family)
VRNLTRWLLLAALIAIVAAGIVWLPVNSWIALGVGWIETHGMFAWLVFILVYAAAAVVLVPGLIFTLAAGFVFGLPLGVAITSAGSTLGACAAFLVGRYLARGWVERRIASHAGFRALDAATRHEGFVIVFLARLSPVFPFALLNYGLALTAVRFRDYALASWIGMIPATLLYVYLGTAVGNLGQLMTGGFERGIAGRVLLLGGLAATVALVVFITRKATQALGKHLQHEIEATDGTE